MSLSKDATGDEKGIPKQDCTNRCSLARFRSTAVWGICRGVGCKHATTWFRILQLLFMRAWGAGLFWPEVRC